MTLKTFSQVFLLINLTTLIFSANESGLAFRQKMILSLCQNLFIKNILLIKETSTNINYSTISFAKSISQSYIYTSLLAQEEIKLIMDEFVNNRVVFSKTIILTLKEESSHKIYELIAEDELKASKFLWLIWDIKIPFQAENGSYYIPYNTQLLTVEERTIKNIKIASITEIYHPRKNSKSMLLNRFGLYSEKIGMDIFVRDLYKRRFNMAWTEIRILMFPENRIFQPWIDFLVIILSSMNFRPIIVNNDDPRSKPEECEIEFFPQIFDETTENPSWVLGFMWKTSIYMYICYDDVLENNGISTYVRPFSKELWKAILISIAIIWICNFVLSYAKKRKKIPSKFGYLSAFYDPIEAFLNQCGFDAQESTHIRITIITIRIIALFIVPAYSAFLLSFILYPNVQLPFTDIKTFVQDGTYKLGFPLLENWDGWFNDTKDPWMKIAYEKYLIPLDKMPYDVLQAAEKVCEGGKVAFFINENYVYAAPCKIVKIPIPIMTGWYGYPLRKKSPYRSIFNRIFKMYRSTGIINKYENTDKWKQIRLKKSLSKDDNDPVEIKNIVSIFQVLETFYAVALIILFLEYLCKHLNFRNKLLSQ